MTTSILSTMKLMLGITIDDESFDQTLMFHINSIFMFVTQLGIGPATGFSISDATSEWDDFLSDFSKCEAVKTYMYLKLKPIFDPSASSVITEAIEKTAAEMEWRLAAIADSIEPEE